MTNNKGYTLIEVMLVIVLIGILATIAVPSFNDMLERNHIKLVTEALSDDLKLARAEAIKRSDNVTLAFTNSCYGITAGGIACICATAGSCTIKSVDYNQFTGITMAGNDVTFSFRRGTTTSAFSIISVISSNHYQTNVISENIGKVSICAIGGLLGYPGC